MIADRTCLFVYQMGLGLEGSYLPYQNTTITDSAFPIKGDITSRHRFDGYLAFTYSLPWRLFFWNGSLLLLAYLFAIGLAVHKRRYDILGYSLIILVNLPALYVFGVSHDFRYVAFLVFGAICLPSFFYLLLVDNDNAKYQ